MAKKKMKATQRGVIYGYITGGSVKEGVIGKGKAEGDSYESYKLKFREKDTKFTFMCDVFRNIDKEESDGKANYLNLVKELAEEASAIPEGEDGIEAILNIYPSSYKDSLTQFTWVTTDITDDGVIFTNINAAPSRVTKPKHIEDFADNKSKLSINMIVDDIDPSENKIRFVSEDEEYQKVLYAFLEEENEDHINAFEIGKGYEVPLGFKKGGIKAVKEGDFSFDENNIETDVSKLIIKGCRPIKDLKINGEESIDSFDAF